jgi:hypothetical protein
MNNVDTRPTTRRLLNDGGAQKAKNAALPGLLTNFRIIRFATNIYESIRICYICHGCGHGRPITALETMSVEAWSNSTVLGGI